MFSSLGGTATPSDSYSNTWTTLTYHTGSSANSFIIYYAQNPTVGTGHTFTYTGFASASQVMAFSGVDTSSPFDVQNGAAAAQPGSVTPSNSGSLLVTGISSTDFVNSFSVDSAFTITGQNLFLNGTYYANAGAYLVQGSASAVNPTWSIGGGPSSPATAIAVFKAGGGGSFTGSLSESVATSDSYTETLSVAGSLTNSTSTSDSYTETSTMSGSLSNSTATSDSFTIGTLTGSISETAATSDAYTETSAMAGSLSDSTATSDSFAAGNFPGSLSETAATSDSYTETTATAATLSETASTSDGYTEAAAGSGTLSNSTATSDSYSGAIGAAASLSETAATSDAYSETSAMAGSLSDSTATSDSYSGVIPGAYTGDIEETAATSDAYTATMDASGALSDTTATSDSYGPPPAPPVPGATSVPGPADGGEEERRRRWLEWSASRQRRTKQKAATVRPIEAPKSAPAILPKADVILARNIEAVRAQQDNIPALGAILSAELAEMRRRKQEEDDEDEAISFLLDD